MLSTLPVNSRPPSASMPAFARWPVRMLLAGARLCEPALGDADAGFGLGNLRPRGVGGGALGVGGGGRRVELLLRHFVLREQTAETLHIARGLRRVRFRLAKLRLCG